MSIQVETIQNAKCTIREIAHDIFGQPRASGDSLNFIIAVIQEGGNDFTIDCLKGFNCRFKGHQVSIGTLSLITNFELELYNNEDC